MLLVILAVIQIVLLAIFVILFVTKGRSDLRNSVPELLTGLADLHASAERFEGKISGDMRTLREDSLSYSKQARQEAAAEARSLREEMSTHLGRLGGQLNDNLSEFRRDQVSAANQLRDCVTAQIDRLVNTTTESDQQLRDVMQEKFAGLQQQVTGQLTDFSNHQVQTSEQLKDSVQTNFSRLGSELRETNKELSGKVQGSLVDLTGRIQELSATNEQKQDALRQVVELRLDKLTESNEDAR
jgi:predicted component of type VI protein secretion system